VGILTTDSGTDSYGQPVDGSQEQDTGGDGEERPQDGVFLECGVVVETGAVVEAGFVGEGSVIEVGARVGRGSVIGKVSYISWLKGSFPGRIGRVVGSQLFLPFFFFYSLF
jgi:hypothetical protein